MKKLITFTICLTALSLCAPLSSNAQEYTKTRILFLLDASGSMLAKWEGNTRISVAKNLLIDMADSLENRQNVEFGLRAYGHTTHRSRQDCKDTRLEVKFRQGSKETIKEALNDIKPKGTTPIAYSLQEAARDFPVKKPEIKNIIILLTDGLEECEGDPCAVSLALQKRGVVLKPFVVGIGTNKNFKAQFDCVGNYYNASTQEGFKQVLTGVISEATNKTTTQVNLLDHRGKATETDVNMTFYDTERDFLKYNFYHTMNSLGVPDTLNIDPFTNYDIQVHTTPEVIKRNVEIKTGQHNEIPIDAAQGTLELDIHKNMKYRRLKAVVKTSKGCKTVNHQSFNTSKRYLTGTYDVEVMTQPKKTFKDVKIKPEETTTLNIPRPGQVSISTSSNKLGSIYHFKGNQMKWISDITPRLRREIIVLQPGKYRLVYRGQNEQRAYKTEVKKFKVKSGGTTTIKLR